MSATKTVMCIEDDEEMIDLVELVLREPNVEMRSVVGADEALEYLRGNTPDLVLLDLYMPRMSGWRAVTAPSSSSSSTPARSRRC